MMATAQLDRFINPLFRYQDKTQYFKRVNFIYVSQDQSIQYLRMFPAQKVQNPNYRLNITNTEFGKGRALLNLLNLDGCRASLFLLVPSVPKRQ